MNGPSGRGVADPSHTPRSRWTRSATRFVQASTSVVLPRPASPPISAKTPDPAVTSARFRSMFASSRSRSRSSTSSAYEAIASGSRDLASPPWGRTDATPDPTFPRVARDRRRPRGSLSRSPSPGRTYNGSRPGCRRSSSTVSSTRTLSRATRTTLGIAHNAGNRLGTIKTALDHGADVIEVDVISVRGALVGGQGPALAVAVQPPVPRSHVERGVAGGSCRGGHQARSQAGRRQVSRRRSPTSSCRVPAPAR